METATSSSTGEYFHPGTMTLKVRSIKYKEGFKGKSVIGEFEVLETNNSVQLEDDTRTGDPVGCNRSYIVKLDKPQAQGDIKNLFLAILGYDPNTFGDPAKYPKQHAEASDYAKSAIDSEYAAKLAKKNKCSIEEVSVVGLKVCLEAFVKKTQKGGDFTIHNWYPAEDEGEAA